jgi:23S rRNA (cytosine1962-C5)-methyltransferase
MSIPTADFKHAFDVNQIIKNIQNLEEATNVGRLFHGRGHFYEGLHFINIDRYDGQLVMSFYQEPERDDVLALVEALLVAQEDVKSVWAQYRCRQGAAWELLHGEEQNIVDVCEFNNQYQVSLGKQQNTGLFLDMSAGRKWVIEHAKGKRVLNLFSFTCAFSVVALAAGADQVVNMDMSRGVLKRGQQNHAMNGLLGATFFAHDVFKSWGKVRRKGPYEMVIIDPPSSQRGSFEAIKDYPRVIRQLSSFCEPEADVLLCLNDPDLTPAFILDMVVELQPEMTFIERINNPAVFKDIDENKSLKVLHFKMPA